ncbi:MAG: hypothetical protein MJK14_23690 [Rivularia sp. ALOHA_DT_140]|nr:hypothetical protein [Rivularia sp. ALOHA_DT_140]
MTHYDEYSQLDLLVPWDLPIDEQLTQADTVKLSQALVQILTALQQVDTSAALVIIQDELSKLASVDISPAKISSTKTPLKKWEVEDFDRHFGVNHVESQQPAFCILKSLMLAVYQMFILLDKQNNPKFDSVQLERQKQGYISYIHLLSRVYHLQNIE